MLQCVQFKVAMVQQLIKSDGGDCTTRDILWMRQLAFYPQFIQSSAKEKKMICEARKHISWTSYIIFFLAEIRIK